METRTATLLGALGGALLVIALAAGAFAGGALTRPSAAQAQGAGVPGMRQVTVVGTGEARVAPDMATVQIGVETTAPTTGEALAQNTAQAQAIIERIRQLGVAERDVQTSGFNIHATYDNEGRNVTGYTVSNTVSVTIRDLAQAGELLDQVVEAGANRVYGVSFGLSDPKAAQAQARDAAVADARARADQLAQAGGAGVGMVLVISENIGGAQPGPMPMMDARAEAAAGAPVPVQAGEQVVTAQVQITYELR
ncbi:MAG TPA: SIMPL domain-containing protein [Chloroflexaceae bacterium]|nr:SIMPL domain-containing protein [Chloroflexaceae bacterium]